jgi:hypothetical protein
MPLGFLDLIAQGSSDETYNYFLDQTKKRWDGMMRERLINQTSY